MNIKDLNISGTLPLKGTQNTRDLGGYITKDKKITKYKEFIRSSSLSNITDEDIDFLVKYGIKTALDLRSEEETKDKPSRLKDINGIKYYNVPLSVDDMQADITKENGYFDMIQGYIKRLSNKKAIKEIFDIISDNLQGGLIFNCTAGKDRTGIIAMLILGIANVQLKDIVANYQVSHTYMGEDPEFVREYNITKSRVFLSKPEFIDATIEYIMDEYSSFDNYLLSCGISISQIEKIKNKFLEDINF